MLKSQPFEISLFLLSSWIGSNSFTKEGLGHDAKTKRIYRNGRLFRKWNQ